MIYIAVKIEDGFTPEKLGEAFSKEYLLNKFFHIGVENSFVKLEILTKDEYNQLLNGN